MSEFKKIVHAFLAVLEREDRRKFYLIIFLLFASGFLSLLSIGAVLPFLSIFLSPEKNKFTNYIPGWSTHHLLILSILILIVAYWIKNIAAWLCLFIQSKLLNEISFKIGRKLFAKYMNAPYLWHLKKNTPELIRNINNETITFGSVLIALGTCITEFISSLLLIIVLSFVDYKFTLAIIISLSISVFWFMRYNMNKTKFYAENRVSAWSAMVKYVLQGLGGFKETAIYHKENYFLQRFNIQSHIMKESSIFSNVFQQTPRFIIELTALTVILLIVLFFIISGYPTQRMFLLLSVMGAAAVQLLPSLNRMMQGVAQVKYGLPSLYILHNELKEHTDLENTSNFEVKDTNVELSFNNKISLIDVCFSYPEGNKAAFQSIALEIKKGEKVAFMGYSGAGKTTLVDVILGLLELQQGKILIDGIELTHKNRSAWQKQLGYVPQMIFLYDCSIRENVAFAEDVRTIDDNKVMHALEIANLKSFVESLPQGLDTLIGENGVRLSGGQRQRLGIARAIYRDPNVLIMDEATSALDNRTEKEVTEAINRASTNRTVITIAHRVSTVINCDTIFLFKHGMLIATGRYEKLLHTSPEFRHMVCNEPNALLISS